MSTISFSAVPASSDASPSHGQVSTLPSKTLDRPLPKGLTPVVEAPQEAAPVAVEAPVEAIDPAKVFAQREVKYKQQITALEQQSKAATSEAQAIAELKSFKEKLAKKDYSELAQLVNYEDYTNFLIEQAGAADPAKAELNALKAEVASLKDTQTSEIEKLFDRVVSERRAEVKQLVETNADFSSIKELKEEEAVVQHILDTYEEDGTELTVEQAAKEVEAELLEQARTWTSLSKLAAKKVEDAAAPIAAPKVAPKVTTLTNSMQAAGEIKRIAKPLYEISNTADRIREARLRAAEKIAARSR
jgi:hypothetical protein